jgi:hypothetical protein
LTARAKAHRLRKHLVWSRPRAAQEKSLRTHAACITSSADLTGATPTFSEISQPSPAMLSELLKFFSLLDELDRSAVVELERAA